MAADKNILISGVPYDVGGVLVKQPTLHEIFKEAGYDAYSAYVYVLGLTLEQFFEATEKHIPGLRQAFEEMSPELQEQLNTYEVLLAEPNWRALLMKALSFFVIGDIVFDEETGRLMVARDGHEAVVITVDLFRNIRSFVYQAGCFKREEEKPKEEQFANSAAKRIYEELMAIKGEMKKKTKETLNPNMELWNLIGAVSTKSHGYTLLNIWGLTVWQLYDQFSRINTNTYLEGYAFKWAAWGTDKFDFDSWYKNSSDTNM